MLNLDSRGTGGIAAYVHEADRSIFTWDFHGTAVIDFKPYPVNTTSKRERKVVQISTVVHREI